MKIKSNTTNEDLTWRFGLYQRPSWEENDRWHDKATCTTDFLPRNITTVARTGRRISFIFFWWRPL